MRANFTHAGAMGHVPTQDIKDADPDVSWMRLRILRKNSHKI
jgi:hypothetical protein